MKINITKYFSRNRVTYLHFSRLIVGQYLVERNLKAEIEIAQSTLFI